MDYISLIEPMTNVESLS